MEGVLEKLQVKIEYSNVTINKTVNEITSLCILPGRRVMMIRGKKMIESSKSLG